MSWQPLPTTAASPPAVPDSAVPFPPRPLRIPLAKNSPSTLHLAILQFRELNLPGSPLRCSKRHRGQLVVSGELTRFSQAPQYRPASPTDRLLKRMETGRGGCCNPSPASVSDQVHQTSYPYEEAF